jgi:two-component system, NtrC family, response regulator AtoC
LLVSQGFRTIVAGTAEAGLNHLTANPVDMIIVDAVLPDGDGFSVLKRKNETRPGVPAIMITSYGSVESAVRAMKLGVLEYLVKPLEYEELKVIIRKSLIKTQQDARRNAVETQRKERYRIENLIGGSPSFRKSLDMVQKIASSPAVTVLIQGESGTGKELVAKAIHYNSLRFNESFVEINCAAIPEGLLEAELFGHEKGAFTGAIRDKKGLFEIAHNGTLFLDEIGHMPIILQAKLVKAIEEKTFRRVGGTKELTFDARVIAATHRDLNQAIKSGEFREDLYYRLHVIYMTLPTLRERGPDDILLLAGHFIKTFNDEYNRSIQGLSDDAQKMMAVYSWPGNLRQLRNCIERAIILESGEWIQGSDLQLEADSGQPISLLDPSSIKLPEQGIDLQKLEDEIIRKAYEKSNGNKTKAAAFLNMSRDTFRYRWERIEEEDRGK